MPLPVGPERLVYAGGTRPFPPSLRGNYLQVGHLHTSDEPNPFPGNNHVQNDPLEYVIVRHVMVDRTLEYRIAKPDARALFIPTNKVRPHLEVGDWYYGPDVVWTYIETETNKANAVQGLLYVRRDAPVWWQYDAVCPADQMPLIIRPLREPREYTPVEFYGLYDECPPECCDES